jgi:hypothetical protein
MIASAKGRSKVAYIKNANLNAEKLNGGTWRIHVRYDAVFSRYELDHFKFRDGFVLWEQDTLSDNDQLSGVVNIEYFNPSTSPMHREKLVDIDEDSLDTEWGEEELYAQIRLRNLDLNILYTKYTPVFSVSP